MKLDNYLIRCAIARRDWPVAINVLANYFGIAAPKKYKRNIRSGAGIFIVELYMQDKVYSWWEKSGFADYLRQDADRISHPKTAVDIWIR